MLIVPRVAGLVVLLLASSCARFAQPVRVAQVAPEKSAVLYGRFFRAESLLGNQIGLRIYNASGKHYTLRFSHKDPLYAVEIEPGTYQIRSFIGTYVDRRIVGRGTLGAAELGRFSDSFQVKRGHAVYIGDFTGVCDLSGLSQEWGIRKVECKFDETTKEFREKYQNLATMPTYCPFISPAKQTPLALSGARN